MKTATLKRARLAAWLTQDALAAKSRVAQTTISRLEAGAANPTVDTLLKLAKALGVKPSLLHFGMGQ